MFADTQQGEIHHTKTNFVENIHTKKEEEEAAAAAQKLIFWTFSWIFPQNINQV